MAITVELPAEVEVFFRAEVARGKALSEAEFLAKTVELYREITTRHENLGARVQKSIEQADRHEVRPLDAEAIKAEGRRRFDQE